MKLTTPKIGEFWHSTWNGTMLEKIMSICNESFNTVTEDDCSTLFHTGLYREMLDRKYKRIKS